MSDEVIRNRVGMSVMLLRFGKYRGSSAGRVVLADQGYAAWALGQPAAAGGLADLRREVLRLVGRYDARPVVAGCFGGGCRRPATGCTLYRGRADPYWWCDACDPVENGWGNLNFSECGPARRPGTTCVPVPVAPKRPRQAAPFRLVGA